jgi:predicted amidohydrolase
LWVGACIQDDRRWYNAAYGFTPQGKTYIYHKINLATHERGTFSAGAELPLFELDTPAGSVLAGVQICRELRFPEQWKALARRGAQIILHLNNAVGVDRSQSVWRSHLISQAETQRFVISANNAAPQQGSPTMAVAPDGLVMGEIVSDQLKTLRVELDLAQVANWYLEQSRTDVVEIAEHFER